ncbi:MAG: serine/threonine protein kinase [Actinomycetota bacterium]
MTSTQANFAPKALEAALLVKGRYDCHRLIKGGPGVETYLARDLERSGQPVVVKLLQTDKVAPAVRVRLQHEASVLARLGHGSFTPLLDYGSDSDFVYLVQPFRPGRNLAEQILEGPLCAESTLSVGCDLMQALQNAHELGILHRDVKPSNIIVEGQDSIVGAHLVDFGLALTASLDATLSDQAVGTARYMAPEQSGVVDATVDERADLYSVGVVLYECLAGRLGRDSPRSVEGAVLSLCDLVKKYGDEIDRLHVEFVSTCSVAIESDNL